LPEGASLIALNTISTDDPLVLLEVLFIFNAPLPSFLGSETIDSLK